MLLDQSCNDARRNFHVFLKTNDTIYAMLIMTTTSLTFDI